MTLRARLTAFFVGIVVVPLAVAGLVLQVLANHQADNQTDRRLDGAIPGVVEAIDQRLDRATSATRLVARRAYRVAAAGNDLDAVRKDAGLDYLVVTRSGTVVGASLRAGDFLPGWGPDAAALGAPTALTGSVVGGRVTITGGVKAEVNGGFYLDRTFLARLRIDGVIVAGGVPVASTITPVPRTVPAVAGPFDVERGVRGLFVPRQGDPKSGVEIVARRDTAGTLADFGGSILVLLGAGLVIATALGYALARLISRPLQRLAEGALAVSRGDLDQTVEAQGKDDVAQLGAAFNTMTDHLRRYVGELQGSRDELRRGMTRLGETLSATHDLEGMLSVSLDTAVVTLGAAAGALYLRPGGKRRLTARVTHGLTGPPIRLEFGEGVAGTAADRARPVLVPSADAPAPSPLEPQAATSLAVPLSRDGKPIGALALYGRTTGEPYSADDLVTLASFAAQASVAIENVLLHRETERMSVTDPLTGTWNRRYLDITLTRELQRARRFHHPLSVLMIDIDHFKTVNDRYGHRHGDQVLGELCRRVLGQVRSMDVLARFGGEEFVLVLPETDQAGAMFAAEKLRKAIGGAPFCRGAQAVRLTASLGVATFPQDGTGMEDLVRASDQALYRAKQAGRNRVAGSS